jgi:hypothetical protein
MATLAHTKVMSFNKSVLYSLAAQRQTKRDEQAEAVNRAMVVVERNIHQNNINLLVYPHLTEKQVTLIVLSYVINQMPKNNPNASVWSLDLVSKSGIIIIRAKVHEAHYNHVSKLLKSIAHYDLSCLNNLYNSIVVEVN